MSVKENKELIARYFRDSNAVKGDARQQSAVATAYISPKSVFHFATGDIDLEQAAQFFAAFYKGYPDMGWAVEDIVAEGDKVVVRSTWSGTQTGEWMGTAPTGKKYTQRSIAIYRIAGGKVVEGWAVNDAMKPA